ncbi:NAD-dependent epimerase/dehydratase family protein [Actinomadura darangshiensis]|uniref:NAD-dependent epimerase/dehydratase family protein n=1 Tax=Actinomadura darangshiensis TaxID=705336 RepID=A0A4R5BJB1_9ACTN|nr:NAD(P)H-binding protein [Actinomadura darangshiensis]TDD85885.1 NAD-dependent epimerase/dehydratase family protein [Actinomadura darangshiensis]
MIIVTGANGLLGRAVVERLLERVPAERVGLSVREPAKAHEFQERGVRVRQGDFGDPASLAHAFEGASQVLIVSVDAIGEKVVAAHRAAIEGAKAAGARRILYTGHMGVNPSSPFPPMSDHAETEAALRESGVAFTALRNGFYASTTVRLLGAALQTGELAVPEDGPVSWTAHADLAEAAAVILAKEPFDGPTPALTAAEAIDMAGVAALASELTGRTIRRTVVSDAEYRAGLVGHGVPESAAQMLVGMFAATRQGEFSHVDPAMGDLIGRPPTPLRDVLKAAIAG